MSENKRDKPELNREKLRAMKIHYEESVYEPSQHTLPDHVEAVRRGLLEFGQPIHLDWKQRFNENHRHRSGKPSLQSKDDDDPKEKWSFLPPSSAYFSEFVNEYGGQNTETESTRKTQAWKDVQDSMRVSELAQRKSHDAESGWTRFLVQNIFKEFVEAIPFRTAFDELFDQWRLEENIHWNECDTWENGGPDGLRRTGPKPDITYAFPIFRRTDDLPPGFSDDDCTRNFSSDFLIALRSQSDKPLVSAPTKGLLNVANGNAKADSLKNHHLMCFPWALVEVKHAEAVKSAMEFCYCQAANAAATALNIQASLFENAFHRTLDDLPPIVTFTCVGPELKVWLAYLCHRSGLRRWKMVCIYATSLELFWGVLSTRLIIKNMHIWASRILRPRLLMCLSLIRAERFGSSVKTLDIQKTPLGRRYIRVGNDMRLIRVRLPKTVPLIRTTEYPLQGPASDHDVPLSPTTTPLGSWTRSAENNSSTKSYEQVENSESGPNESPTPKRKILKPKSRRPNSNLSTDTHRLSKGPFDDFLRPTTHSGDELPTSRPSSTRPATPLDDPHLHPPGTGVNERPDGSIERARPSSSSSSPPISENALEFAMRIMSLNERSSSPNKDENTSKSL